jgi:hypothetical protein
VNNSEVLVLACVYSGAERYCGDSKRVLQRDIYRMCEKAHVYIFLSITELNMLFERITNMQTKSSSGMDVEQVIEGM